MEFATVADLDYYQKECPGHRKVAEAMLGDTVMTNFVTLDFEDGVYV
jgi:hypothetical protein